MAKNSGMIDLGVAMKSPSVVESKPMPSEKKHYPTIHISDVAELHDLPDGEFSFMATGRLVAHSSSKRNGVEHCSCEIEITSMKPMEGQGNLEKALDKIASKKK